MQCCKQTGPLADPACKVSAWAVPGCDCGSLICGPLFVCASGNPGSKAPCITYCAAELFDIKYVV